MWLTIALVFLVLWFLAVGFFHVSGNAVHLLAVLAMASLGVHLMRRRRKVA